jgi:hypothetical protein
VPLGICRSSFPRTLNPTEKSYDSECTCSRRCSTASMHTHAIAIYSSRVPKDCRGHQPGSTASPNKLITQSGNCDGKVTQPKGEIGQRPTRLHSFPKQVFSFSSEWMFGRCIWAPVTGRLPDLLAWDMSRHVCTPRRVQHPSAPTSPLTVRRSAIGRRHNHNSMRV